MEQVCNIVASAYEDLTVLAIATALVVFANYCGFKAMFGVQPTQPTRRQRR